MPIYVLVTHLWLTYPLVCVALMYPILRAVRLYAAAMLRTRRITPRLLRHVIQYGIKVATAAILVAPICVPLLLHVPIPTPQGSPRLGIAWIAGWYFAAIGPAVVFLNRPAVRTAMREMEQRRFV